MDHKVAEKREPDLFQNQDDKTRKHLEIKHDHRINRKLVPQEVEGKEYLQELIRELLEEVKTVITRYIEAELEREVTHAAWISET